MATSRSLPRSGAEEAKHVLGAQGQIWTEYIPDPSRRLDALGVNDRPLSEQ